MHAAAAAAAADTASAAAPTRAANAAACAAVAAAFTTAAAAAAAEVGAFQVRAARMRSLLLRGGVEAMVVLLGAEVVTFVAAAVLVVRAAGFGWCLGGGRTRAAAGECFCRYRGEAVQTGEFVLPPLHLNACCTIMAMKVAE